MIPTINFITLYANVSHPCSYVRMEELRGANPITKPATITSCFVVEQAAL